MQESGENYLETILILSRQLTTVRSIDVANELGYAKPSISRAMSILRKNGYLEMDRHGALTLTEAGLEKAKAIYERHQVIARFLAEALGVDQSVAERDACRIEHVLSEETFERIRLRVSGRDAGTGGGRDASNGQLPLEG
ncbi:MAG: metal-dependent transcriptional regulator [Clostridiales bacterium]|nr:metal-dependent transcriptional regulator [Clostridiales bacterium]